MKPLIPYGITLLVTVVSWLGLRTFVPQSTFDSIYDQKLQLACFTAFLTIGSFLLAMKAFILVRLRDDVYKHESYQARYLVQNNNKYCGDYYKGLIELGHLLVVSVASSFTASVAQVTVGFASCYDIKLIAPSLCIGVLFLVFIDWLYVYLNLKDWFGFIEDEARQTIETKQKENKQ